MEVSVIVPTYNRGKQVLILLESLQNQSFKDFEVIVVNDGSTDDTLSILHQYKIETSLNLKIIDSENLGRSGSRNLGVQKAEGEILVFFDDDVRPNKESIKVHYDFQIKNDFSLLAGPCLYDMSKFSNDFQFFRKELEERGLSQKEEAVISKSMRFNGANFSIKKKLFSMVGGFDERLQDKEDFNLSFTLYKRFKVKTYSLYSTWVYHDDFKDLNEYLERGKESRKEEQKLRLINPDIELFQPERFVLYPKSKIKALLFRFFKFPFVINFLSKSSVFLFFPRYFRFKIYDITITANITYLKI